MMEDGVQIIDVVIPYYLSLRYNLIQNHLNTQVVVIPYYLSLRYNYRINRGTREAVVIPYYLSLRYNTESGGNLPHWL